MNKNRLKAINKIRNTISQVKSTLEGMVDGDNNTPEGVKAAVDTLEGCKSELETCREEEQEYYDNMPEGLQGSEKGDTAQEWIEKLEEQEEKLDEAIDTLEDEDGCLDEAIEALEEIEGMEF